MGSHSLGYRSAGHRTSYDLAGRTQRTRSGGALRLPARRLSNPQIGPALVVSSRPAEHHVQHIYAKIGVSTRAAAALFAMQHGLLPL
ncbi:MAG: response regulator transcription factor [Jiangellaceae bacterium]